ncbi:MAG: hypothetical protein GX343_00670 [Erysipelotrichaceae bacterium]|jgi:hypothetical protein|nr:hypothetical protein [Bacillota bacterium]MDY0118018.1 hypothetical protein [Bacilli bacterium]NLJ32334.1 hypothetical protein [Erysipelotrichaceae bacterium]
MARRNKRTALSAPLTEEEKALRAYNRKKGVLIGIIILLFLIVVVEIVTIVIEFTK